jgi:hypothetical protein
MGDPARADSFTSLCNVGSLEERTIASRSNINEIEREIVTKNSFIEWANNRQRNEIIEKVNQHINRDTFRFPTF